MSRGEARDEKASDRDGIHRWIGVTVGLFAWLVALPLAHGVLPWFLSSLTRRHGWIGGRPGFWNLLGLVPVSAGAACLVWCLALGLRRIPELPRRMEGLTPPFLMTRGPYSLTRNPMYVAELALWLGWTTLYGSLAVGLGLAALCVAVRIIVPREEGALEARFGEAYRQYKAAVPRWLGRTRR